MPFSDWYETCHRFRSQVDRSTSLIHHLYTTTKPNLTLDIGNCVPTEETVETVFLNFIRKNYKNIEAEIFRNINQGKHCRNRGNTVLTKKTVTYKCYNKGDMSTCNLHFVPFRSFFLAQTWHFWAKKCNFGSDFFIFLLFIT